MNRHHGPQEGDVVGQRANKRLKRSSDPLPEEIRNPRFQDVLCGRGGKSNKWPGNVIFRQVVQRNKDRYQSTEMPHHKGFLVVSIIEAIHRQCPPGRFLRFDKESNSWQEIPRKEAFSKTSQALREQEGGARKPEELPALEQVKQEATATTLAPESVKSRVTKPACVVTTDADVRVTLPKVAPQIVVLNDSKEVSRPVYGVPSRVPLEDDDSDSVVCEFETGLNYYSQETDLGKSSGVARLRPLQIHVGIPFTACRHQMEDYDDQAAIISTGPQSNHRSSDSEDFESEFEDDAYGIPPLPGCKMRAPSMTELLQREDSLAFENAIYQI